MHSPDRLQVVSLDLDDTLWAIAPVLRSAEHHLWRWLKARCPRVVARHSPHALRERRERIAADRPDRRHDLGWLRRQTLVEVLNECGYRSDTLPDEAMAVFVAARSDVQPWPDVRPALARLKARYTVVALTNGNADLAATGLSPWFDHCLSAADVGAAKPDAAMFDALLCATGARAEAVLHAGDDPVADVAGAREAGMHAVWINRDARPWPTGQPPAHWEVTDLLALVQRLDPA